jgi:NADPH-dependent 2,4-dienoyl-CoA reductase/sulfur reductase-like enzyme
MNAQARGLVEAGPHLLDRAVVAAYGHTAVERVELDDGPTLDADADADAVVVGIGITPSTGWLAGSGLSRDNGLLCTKYLHSVDTASVFAAGDVARWHNPRYGTLHRAEHWTSAREQAAVVVDNLSGHP